MVRLFIPSAAIFYCSVFANSALAVEGSFSLQLSVPIVCKVSVQIDDAESGTFRELCNVLDPYAVTLTHATFDSTTPITLDYDGETIALNPAGQTELPPHARGGLFKRPFRVQGGDKEFIETLKPDAAPLS